ncbi:AMP-binding protein [Rhizobium sp. XQZ8]|uniref:AMP-binding protein n=1 Tax=Rhizobium populisoli TaxID=2859785 RepID=UPI001CA51CE2|nr:AMP-binding protein [Rhizobium populisoli]MBW6422591.1 AMP-binding protein [Rhizobium populisoli]
MNLISTFIDTAGRLGDRVAIVEGSGRRITFSALAERSAEVAGTWSRLGIGKGDRVLIAMPVGIDLYTTIAALWRLGATIVFPEPALGLSGLKHAVGMTKPKAVVTAGWYRLLPYLVPALWSIPGRLTIPTKAEARNVLETVGHDHPALISFTSGSTGMPKGISRSHGFLAAQNACVAQMLATSNEEERDLVAFPVFVIANMALGITSVLPNWKSKQPEKATSEGISSLVAREKITRALIPPVICDTLARGGIDPGLSAIFTGGGPVFPDLMQTMRQAMPDTAVMAVYGSTEAEPIAHQQVEDITADDWQRMETGGGLLAGHPIEQTRVRIIDDEIVVTGDHVNKGYLEGRGDGENKLRIDGEIWHRTGDAGRLDEKGRLWLRGRLSAKAGNVYPFEVEVAARTWPGVRRVALVPNTDPPVVAVEGDEPSPGLWRMKGAEIGVADVRNVPVIPLDRRHRSKIDYAVLRDMLR